MAATRGRDGASPVRDGHLVTTRDGAAEEEDRNVRAHQHQDKHGGCEGQRDEQGHRASRVGFVNDGASCAWICTKVSGSRTETSALALCAAVGSAALAYYVPQYVAQQLTDFPLLNGFTPDWRVFAFTLGLALLAGCIAGLSPGFYSRDAAFGRSRAQRKTITRPHSSHRYTGPAVRCSTNVSWEEPHCGHTAAGESGAMTAGRVQALCRRSTAVNTRDRASCAWDVRRECLATGHAPPKSCAGVPDDQRRFSGSRRCPAPSYM